MTLALLLLTACDKRLPHGGGDPVYPLRGLHAAAALRGLPRLRDARDAPDRLHRLPRRRPPGAGPQPGPGLRDLPHRGGLGRGPHGHAADARRRDRAPAVRPRRAPAEQLCWDCHEAERSEPTHYADLVEPGEELGLRPLPRRRSTGPKRRPRPPGAHPARHLRRQHRAAAGELGRRLHDLPPGRR